MNNKNKLIPSQTNHIKTIRKLIFGLLILLVIPPFLVMLVAFLFSELVPPDIKRSKALIMLIAKHEPYGKLIYSKTDGFLASMCFVYKYPEEHYKNHNKKKFKYTYLNQNQDYDEITDYHSNVKENKGCTTFLSDFDSQNIEQFIEVDHYSKYGRYGRGSKTFINYEYRLIMFEGYLND